jgi:F-type H+-transporting ATPase subunit delta
MKDRKLATRYAKALLAALPAAGDQDLAGAFLTALAASVESNPDLNAFFLDPATPSAAKKALLAQLAEARGIPERVKSFVNLLVDNRRLADLPSIAQVFHREREAGQGQVSATLTSATPLVPELAARAVTALEKLSGRKVNLTVAVDPSLLGGAITQIGSMVYDGSLKTQLARLRSTMGED